ncbi:unnamed protein product [Dovyalis caffra]|uniref:Uncharacterized protein n=1 Tax=Dovyalis caffra TaxID=77055 RepID=A0AAV1SV17_9ROSI|nr:unnamed protein product [Dovyalis caffra]
MANSNKKILRSSRSSDYSSISNDYGEAAFVISGVLVSIKEMKKSNVKEVINWLAVS